MPRKTTNDPAARVYATEFIRDASENETDGRGVADMFIAAEFETATSKVGGAEIEPRRIVLTGPWEVVKN